MSAKIRKIIVQTDEVRVEMGRDVVPPVRKALAMAVIDNPCAGRYVESLDELVAIRLRLLGPSVAEDDAPAPARAVKPAAPARPRMSREEARQRMAAAKAEAGL